MEQTGQFRIRAPRNAVWEALQDPEILGRCIPGCESIEAAEKNRFVATVTARVGPVKARFQGEITLSDLNPPESYTLKGNGQGGAAGFARGEARVRLEEQNGDTLLKYDVGANVGGKLAQLGSRLVDGAARKFADDFFASFKQVLEGEPSAADEEPSAAGKEPSAAGKEPSAADGEESTNAPAAETGARAKRRRATSVIWIVVVVALAAAAIFFL